MSALHVFAVNADIDARHTHLTRARGEASDLPPLAGWIGTRALDTDRVELFPVDDLGELNLSDYLAAAFDAGGPDLATAARRLNALVGHVLLVPDTAMTGGPSAGPEVTLVATLQLPEPDHGASLPRADVTAGPVPGNAATEPRSPRSGSAMVFFALLALLALLVWSLAS